MGCEIMISGHQFANALQFFTTRSFSWASLISLWAIFLLLLSKEAHDRLEEASCDTVITLIKRSICARSLAMATCLLTLTVYDSLRDSSLLIINKHEVIVKLLAVIIINCKVLISSITSCWLALREIQNCQDLIPLIPIIPI